MESMHTIIKYIGVAFIFYVAYCGFLFLIQRQILYPRNLIPSLPPSTQKIPGLEKIWLETSFGKVESWLLRPAVENPSAPVPAVIFAHGNGELIDFWPDELKSFTRFGLALLLVEYPGYGRSAGKPSQESITETFIAAYDALTARKDIDRSRIVLFGRSLGGGAVCALAAQRPSKALILMSTFTSVRSFAVRYLVPGFFARDPFDNLALVSSYSGPILFLHGKYDGIIPFRHSLALHKAAKKSQLIAYDAGHNDCPPDWNVFWQHMESFLREIEIIDRKP
jgi:pimeloyl-ACP methyl ester carboxylesterase